MNEKINKSPIIYLDHNIISDLANNTTKENTQNIQLLGNLIYLQRNKNILIPYSDVHLFELSLTGLNSNLSNKERKMRIEKDLGFIKAITSSKKLELNPASGKFYMHDKCPIDQYKIINEEVPFFPKMYKDLINFMPPKLIKIAREQFGFDKGRLNKFKSIEEVQNEIDKKMAEIPEIMKILTPIQKIQNESLQKEVNINAIFLATQAKEEFENFALAQLDNPTLTEEERIAIQTLIEEKLILMNESISNIKNVNPKLISEKKIESTKNFDIKALFKGVGADINLIQDEVFLNRYMRNFWGFHSKSPKKGQTSDYFDIQHASYMDIVSVFITHENENFRNRFGNTKCKIFNKSDFLDYLKNDCNLDIKVNIKSL